MRITVAVAALGLMLSACGSMDDRSKANLISPELNIRQLNSTGAMPRTITGPMPVSFQTEITNNSAEEIKLERIEIQSIGSGAYTIGTTSRPFDKVIQPSKAERVEFWVPANIEDTLTGANGPVTVRVTAYFRSAVGRFREIYVRNVNDTITQKPQIN